MDRRRFMAALAGGLATAGGCASNELTDWADPGTAPNPAARPGTAHAGPTATARAPGQSTGPPTNTAGVVTSTEAVTVTPSMTAATANDDGGSAGGGAGGSGSPSELTTPTVTLAEPAQSSPLRLSLSSVTMQRVVGELTCTAGPLAWMAVDVGFLRGEAPVESERRRRDEPGTGEILAFDVASDAPGLDGVRIATSFAHPAP